MGRGQRKLLPAPELFLTLDTGQEGREVGSGAPLRELRSLCGMGGVFSMKSEC